MLTLEFSWQAAESSQLQDRHIVDDPRCQGDLGGPMRILLLLIGRTDVTEGGDSQKSVSEA